MTHSPNTDQTSRAQQNSVTGNDLFDLSYLKLAIVTGEDATHFLQGQLSNDINLLSGNSRHQLSAYCTPKGRVMASFDILKLDDGYALIAPEAVLNKVLPRLRMFVMRSAVSIELATSSDLAGLQFYEQNAGVTLTDLHDMGAQCYQHNNDSQRFFVIANANVAALIQNKHHELKAYGENQWRLTNIKQNLPEVFEQTYEAFIPQSINLDLVNGVNFKKGCYPGQEIIARIKYRGKPKTRMIAVRTNINQAIKTGDPIFIDGRNTAAGMVSNTATEDTGILLSITIPVTHLHQGSLYLDPGRSIEVERLPCAYDMPA